MSSTWRFHLEQSEKTSTRDWTTVASNTHQPVRNDRAARRKLRQSKNNNYEAIETRNVTGVTATSVSFFFPVSLFFHLTKSMYERAFSRGSNLRRLEIQLGETKIVYPRGRSGWAERRKTQSGRKDSSAFAFAFARRPDEIESKLCSGVAGWWGGNDPHPVGTVLPVATVSYLSSWRFATLLLLLPHTRGLRQIPYIGLGSCGTATRRDEPPGVIET